MEPILVFFIAFLFILSGAVLGLYLNSRLPEHHLSASSKDAIKVGAGLIATLTALVIGLLVSSAKTSFDSMNDEIKEASAQIIILDHLLVKYGPAADPARDMIKSNLAFVLEKIWPEEMHSAFNRKADMKAFEKAPGVEAITEKIRELDPQTSKERVIQDGALQICNQMTQGRWLFIEQSKNTLPVPFLAVLIFWLAIFFLSFGLLAPHNSTVIAVIVVCTISVAGAIYLIMEMNSPLSGYIKVSSVPLQNALVHISS
jgi:hypothetical protein